METLKWVKIYENKLQIQRYSSSTIKSYKQVICCFLNLAAKKYNNPADITDQAVEKYILWLIEHKNISQSYQKIDP